LSFDYSQIELRVLAHLSKDTALTNALKKGEEIHRKTASFICGVKESEVSERMRDDAKRINFGIIYGLSAYGLSRDLNIAPEEASRFIDAYFLKYPKVKKYVESQIKYAQNNGFVTTLLGRRRYLPEINSKNMAIRQFAQRQAVNTPIQGSASDLIKMAMNDIHKLLKKNKLSSRMIMQIHDELVFEAPLKELESLVKLVKDSMENVLKLAVPIKVDIKKGKNWLDMEPIR
jgi:DNA polymerase-1